METIYVYFEGPGSQDQDLGSEDEMIIYQIISLAVLHRGFLGGHHHGGI